MLEQCLKGMNDLKAKCAPYHCQPHSGGKLGAVSAGNEHVARAQQVYLAKEIRRLNLISRTYSFESTKISI